MMNENTMQEKQIHTYGKWVVVIMFGLGFLATGFMFVYWNMHVGPFVPFQKLLEQEFPNSKPLVEGGQRKMRDPYPKILRVTMKVNFDPTAKSEKRKLYVSRVEKLIIERFDDVMQDFALSDFEKFELYLFLPQPEKKVKTWECEISVEELKGQFQTEPQ